MFHEILFSGKIQPDIFSFLQPVQLNRTESLAILLLKRPLLVFVISNDCKCNLLITSGFFFRILSIRSHQTCERLSPTRTIFLLKLRIYRKEFLIIHLSCFHQGLDILARLVQILKSLHILALVIKLRSASHFY